MSYITDMILIPGMGETAENINAWCYAHDEQRHQQFEEISTSSAGGVKVFCTDVWAMAGNYFPYYDLTAALVAGEIETFPGSLLIIEPEESDNSQVWRHSWETRRWIELAPQSAEVPQKESEEADE